MKWSCSSQKRQRMDWDGGFFSWETVVQLYTLCILQIQYIHEATIQYIPSAADANDYVSISWSHFPFRYKTWFTCNTIECKSTKRSHSFFVRPCTINILINRISSYRCNASDIKSKINNVFGLTSGRKIILKSFVNFPFGLNSSLLRYPQSTVNFYLVSEQKHG